MSRISRSISTRRKSPLQQNSRRGGANQENSSQTNKIPYFFSVVFLGVSTFLKADRSSTFFCPKASYSRTLPNLQISLQAACGYQKETGKGRFFFRRRSLRKNPFFINVFVENCELIFAWLGVKHPKTKKLHPSFACPFLASTSAFSGSDAMNANRNVLNKKEKLPQNFQEKF